MKELEKWAQMVDDRGVIEDFFEWLLDRYTTTRICDIHVDKTLDEYHEIDRRKLDNERRELLNSNKGDKAR